MSLVPVAKELKKYVKGTNIIVRKKSTDGVENEETVLLNSILNDDLTELKWFHKTLRPERNLVHPSEAFLHSIKALRPAVVFNTFDIKKAKLRRLTKQQKDKKKALARRMKEVAPTAAFKASINPHKTPRASAHPPEEEIRFLARGKSPAKASKEKTFFTKWKKEKSKKIGSKI